MKRITFLLFAALLSVCVSTASAAVISLSPGDNVAATLASAADGDIIELSAEGTYNWLAMIIINTPKSFTIRAAAGLTTRPIIEAGPLLNFTFLFASQGTAAGTYTFDGVAFDGKMHTPVVWTVKCAAGLNVDLVINNCLVKGLSKVGTVDASAISYSNSAANLTPNNLTVTNSVFLFDGLGVFNASGAGRPKNVTFTNCFFKGNYVKTIANASNSVVDLYSIDHCTFEGNNSMDVSLWGNVDLKNCIFSNSTSTGSGSTANAFGTGGNLMTKCGLFYAGAADKAFPNAILDATTLLTDPKINQFGFATAAAYKTPGGTDGNPIGFYEANGLTVESLTTGISNTKMDSKSLIVSQVGNSFSVNGAADAAYAVYNVTGKKVAAGVLSNGKMNLNVARNGIYLLNTNGKVAKFVVK